MTLAITNRVLAAVLLVFCAQQSSAQGAAGSPPYQGYWTWGGYLESMSFDPEVRYQGIDDSAVGIGLNSEYALSERLSINLGGAIVVFDDDDSFSQQVESVYGGNRSTESSSVTGFNAFADLGSRFRFGAGKRAFASLRGGVGQFFLVERGIANCTDCYSEKVDVNGGVYVQGGFGRDFERLRFGVMLSTFLSGDQSASLTFTLGGR